MKLKKSTFKKLTSFFNQERGHFYFINYFLYIF
jgi:hypothetical protein